MRNQQPIKLVDESREFRIDELFFSTTDHRGVIQTGNAVFSRVSGYDFDQLLGQPHNIIRHPDMPRAVFKLFWDYLKAGNLIAAYVKNLAQDGRYYWVVALAAPIDGGYLSVRFKPSSDLLPQVEAIYRELLTLEETRVAAGDTPSQAMAASSERLNALLAAAGFPDYRNFMFRAIATELHCRDAQLQRSGQELVPAPPPAGERRQSRNGHPVRASAGDAPVLSADQHLRSGTGQFVGTPPRAF
jgi:PAS domain S-box-containing protein